MVDDLTLTEITRILTKIQERVNIWGDEIKDLKLKTDKMKGNYIYRQLALITDNKTILKIGEKIQPILLLVFTGAVVYWVFQITTGQTKISSTVMYITIIVVVIAIVYVLSKFGGK